MSAAVHHLKHLGPHQRQFAVHEAADADQQNGRQAAGDNDRHPLAPPTYGTRRVGVARPLACTSAAVEHRLASVSARRRHCRQTGCEDDSAGGALRCTVAFRFVEAGEPHQKTRPHCDRAIASA